MSDTSEQLNFVWHLPDKGSTLHNRCLRRLLTCNELNYHLPVAQKKLHRTCQFDQAKFELNNYPAKFLP
jgi:hypothetical protein